jgi:hypothetical protein
MPIRMHRYDDGLTGLAAFCDTCGEQITERGYIIWNGFDVNDWLVVHQARCDRGHHDRHRYGHSMPLDVEIVHLANSAGVDLEATRERMRVFG